MYRNPGSSYPANQAEQLASAGVASRVSELQKTVSETCEIAYNLRGALGILVPVEEGKTAAVPSSLIELLLTLRLQLTKANKDFRDVLTHINS
jgi:hypothetical protein